MAIYGKRRYKRRMALRKKRYVKKGKTSVRSLAKKVSYLSKKVAHNTAKQNLYMNVADQSAIVGDYNYYNLCQWNAMTPVFGTNSTDWTNSNKLYHKKMSIDWKLELGNEINNTTFTMFVVSLRDNANITSRWNPLSGGISLVAGEDYTILNGQARMNPRLWKIHYYKKAYFTLFGATPTIVGPTGSSSLCVKRGTIRLTPKCSVSNGAGNVASLATSLDPSKQYYFLVFSDNSSADLEYPRFTCMVNHSIDVAQ